MISNLRHIQSLRALINKYACSKIPPKITLVDNYIPRSSYPQSLQKALFSVSKKSLEGLRTSQDISLERNIINRYWRSVRKGEIEYVPNSKLEKVETEQDMINLIEMVISQNKILSPVIKSLKSQEFIMIYNKFSIDSDCIYKIVEDAKINLSPSYENFFSQIHKLPEGFIFLVHMRGDILVALTTGISRNVKDILDPNLLILDDDVQIADTAVFYSINSQIGVSGVDLGNFLIKRVVGEIQSEMPKVKNFVTLSPLPRFSSWLINYLSSNDNINIDITENEVLDIKKIDNSQNNWNTALKNILEARGWINIIEKRDALKPVLLKLAKL
ncbi:Malonyl-CoA decarboxylase, mitochondrial [Smittium culicis]|uniref:Malonyl-CoA decarboxylase, mitochondrial n=1 Tax=Smittium culicis TaxID=133412 RepID=A0A1R1Y7P2_9FUNG|nr:Malonyl-CoA decarboxylase, mitochondrial [Smittium culicis]